MMPAILIVCGFFMVPFLCCGDCTCDLSRVVTVKLRRGSFVADPRVARQGSNSLSDCGFVDS
jgi:hypothetical protein